MRAMRRSVLSFALLIACSGSEPSEEPARAARETSEPEAVRTEAEAEADSEEELEAERRTFAAAAEGDAMIERARESIEREKDAALDELRKESVDLALAAAAKLVQESLDEKKDRELVMGFIEELNGEGEIQA